MKIKILCFTDAEEIKEEMQGIGASPEGIAIMAPKYIFIIIKLFGIRNTAANIIKQEMLRLGGEAAVHKDTVRHKVKNTDVLLGATLQVYNKLIQKLKIQVAELPEIGKAIQKKLN